jgi:integrase
MQVNDHERSHETRWRSARSVVFFLTGCRVSAVTAACVGHLETDGVEHYLHVTEKRNKKRRKLLLDAARPVLAYVAQAGIKEDKEGPLFRPLTPDGTGFERRHLDRKTPWRLVKKYCKAAGIDPDRLGQRGIGIHSLRKTAINDAIRNGAQMHEVREFAGHSDIRTTEIYFNRKEEDGEVAARKIQIRLTGHKGGKPSD